MTAVQNGLPADADTVVQSYCVHCRNRRQMQGAIQVCNRRGRYDLKGHCMVCGTAMYHLGGWDAVAAAQKSRQESSGL